MLTVPELRAAAAALRVRAPASGNKEQVLTRVQDALERGQTDDERQVASSRPWAHTQAAPEHARHVLGPLTPCCTVIQRW